MASVGRRQENQPPTRKIAKRQMEPVEGSEGMAPSEYMLTRTMTTQQLMASVAASGRKGPPRTKIVEFFNLAESSNHKESDVDIDEPLFTPSPDHIVFQNYEPFKPIDVILRMRNQDKVGRRIKAIPPHSPHFAILGPKFPGSLKSTTGKVAPGMEIEFVVRFTPDDVKDFSWDLVFVTEREKFVVPVRAIGARGGLDLPDKVVFEEALVKRTTEQALHLRNIGQSAVHFTLSSASPFSVSPADSTLAVGKSTQINIGFNAEKSGSYNGNLEVSLDTGEKILVELIGHACDANVSLDRPLVRLEPTYVTLESAAMARLRNYSDSPVHYTWKRCASTQEEQQVRLQRSVALAREEGEARKTLLMKGGDVVSQQADLALINRKFKQRRREIEGDQFLFDENVLSVSPLEGDLWPNSQVEVTITFRPKSSISYSMNAYCDVTGRESRLPLAIKAQGLGPNAVFAFDSLNVGDIFVESKHEYQIFMENRGEILAKWRLLDSTDSDANLRADRFVFSPNEGELPVGAKQTIDVSMASDTLGKFERRFVFDVEGASSPLHFDFRGAVIGPTFSFDERSLDFGVIPFGFLASRSVTLRNTSEIPLRYSIRVPREFSASREYEVTPAQGVLEPFANRKLQIDFIPSQVTRYRVVLVVDIDNVGEAMLSLPMTAQCVVPKISVAEDHIDFGQSFIRYPYEREIIFVNESDVPARYEMVPQDENSLDLAVFEAVPTEGVIPAQSDHSIVVRATCRSLGAINVPVYFRIQGSQQPPIMVTLLAHSVGPVVHVEPTKVDMGKIDVLKDVRKKLKLVNKSLIPANFKAFSKTARPAFRVEPAECMLQPGQELLVDLVANLDDTLRFKEDVVISVMEGDSKTITSIATGIGTTVIPKEGDLEEVDFGVQFAGQMQSHEFVLENKGRRAVALKWVSDRELPVNDRTRDAKAPVARPPSFYVTPAGASLDPRTQLKFKIEGTSFNPGSIHDHLICLAQVGSAGVRGADPFPIKNKGMVIYEVKVSAKFVVPLVQFNPKEVHFVYRHDTEQAAKQLKKLEPQTQVLKCKNITKLALDLNLGCDPPFEVDRTELHLDAGQEVDLNIIFDPGYKEDRSSEKTSSKLVITYNNHPQEDIVDLLGEICFPNAKLSVGHIDFGIISNDTEQSEVITIENDGRFPVNYRWMLYDDSDEFRVMAKDPLAAVEVESVHRFSGSGPMLPQIKGGGQWVACSEFSVVDVYDITPIYGTIPAGSSVPVAVKCYGHPNRKFKAKAICDVIGGPEYHLRLYSEASELRFELEKNVLDYGLTPYNSVAERELVIHNRGLVSLDFTIHTDLVTRPDIVELSQTSGKIEGQSKQTIRVWFRPGIPEVITEKLVVQVAHFPLQEVTLKAAGTYPRLWLHLPRADDEEFKAFVEKAKEALDTSGDDLHPMVNSIITALEKAQATPRTARSGNLSFRQQKTQRRDSTFSTPRTDYIRTQSVPEAYAELLLVRQKILTALAAAAAETKTTLRSALPTPAAKKDAAAGGPARVDFENGSANFIESWLASAGYGSTVTSLPAAAAAAEAAPEKSVEKEKSATAKQPAKPSKQLKKSRTQIKGKVLSRPVVLAAAQAQAEHISKFTIAKYALDLGHVVKGTMRRRVFRILNTGHSIAQFDLDGRKLIGTGFAVEAAKLVRLNGLPKCDSLELAVSMQSRSQSVVSGTTMAPLYIRVKNGPSIEIMLKCTVVIPDVNILPNYVDFGKILCGQVRVAYIQLVNSQSVPCEWEAMPPSRVQSSGDAPGAEGLDGGTFRTPTLPSARPAPGVAVAKNRIPTLGGGKRPASIVGDREPAPSVIGADERLYASGSFQHFSFAPSSGLLQPKQRVNVAVRFAPTEHRSYLAMFNVRINLNPEPQRVVVKGGGIMPALRVDEAITADKIPIGAVLPYGDPIEHVISFSNPTDFPLEFYSPDFDAQHQREEEVLSSFPNFVNDVFLLPPRKAGEVLYPPLVENCLHRMRQKALGEAERKTSPVRGPRSPAHNDLIPSVSAVEDIPLDANTPSRPQTTIPPANSPMAAEAVMQRAQTQPQLGGSPEAAELNVSALEGPDATAGQQAGPISPEGGAKQRRLSSSMGAAQLQMDENYPRFVVQKAISHYEMRAPVLSQPLPTILPKLAQPPPPKPVPHAVGMIVTGPPCSGRSTVSANLATLYGATTLNLDVILREIVGRSGALSRRLNEELKAFSNTGMELPDWQKPKLIPFQNAHLLKIESPDAQPGTSENPSVVTEKPEEEKKTREEKRKEEEPHQKTTHRKKTHRAGQRAEKKVDVVIEQQKSDQAEAAGQARELLDSIVSDFEVELSHVRVSEDLILAILCNKLANSTCQKGVIVDGIDSVYVASEEVVLSLWLRAFASLPDHYCSAEIIKLDVNPGVCRERNMLIQMQAIEAEKKKAAEEAEKQLTVFKQLDEDEYDAMDVEEREAYDVALRAYLKEKRAILKKSKTVVLAETETEGQENAPQALDSSRKDSSRRDKSAREEKEPPTPKMMRSDTKGDGLSSRRKRKEGRGEGKGGRPRSAQKKKDVTIAQPVVTTNTDVEAPAAEGADKAESEAMIDLHFETRLCRHMVVKSLTAIAEKVLSFTSRPDRQAKEVRIDATEPLENVLELLHPPLIPDPKDLIPRPDLPMVPLELGEATTFDIVRKPVKRQTKRNHASHFFLKTPVPYSPFGPLVPPPPKVEEEKEIGPSSPGRGGETKRERIESSAETADVEPKAKEESGPAKSGRRERRRDKRGARGTKGQAEGARDRDREKEREREQHRKEKEKEDEDGEKEVDTVVEPVSKEQMQLMTVTEYLRKGYIHGMHEADPPKPERARWIVPPRGRVDLVACFASNRVGTYNQTLTFELVNLPQGAPGKEIIVNLQAKCAFPDIVRDPKTVFMASLQEMLAEKEREHEKPVRERDITRQLINSPSVRQSMKRVASGASSVSHKEPEPRVVVQPIRNRWIASKGVFDFGPLLITRKSENMREKKDREHYENVRFMNKGEFPANVTLCFKNQADPTKGPFFLSPQQFEILPKMFHDVTLWAYPEVIGQVSDVLICTVDDNPSPVTFKIACAGTKPEVTVSTKAIAFDRLLLGRKETETFTVTNSSLLPVSVRIPDAEALGDDLKLSTKYARIGANETVEFELSFHSQKAGSIKKQFKIEVNDVFGVSAVPVQVEHIQVTAEAYEVVVDVQFPKNTEGDMLNFHIIRVGEEAKQQFSLKNKGRYPVNYKCEIGEKLQGVLALTPIEGVLQSGDKMCTINATMISNDCEIALKNCADLIVKIYDISNNDILSEFPIHVSVRAVFAKYRVLPQLGLNFGPLLTGTKKSRTVELHNDGEFDVRFKILPYDHAVSYVPASNGSPTPTPVKKKGKGTDSARRGAPGSPSKSRPKRAGMREQVLDNSKRDGAGTDRGSVSIANTSTGFEKISTSPLSIGPFVVSPGGGTVAPKTVCTIAVDFLAQGCDMHNEVICIDVEHRDPAEPKLAYELAGEAVEPGLNVWEYNAIFEEQQIRARLDGLKAQNSVFAVDSRIFHFGAITAGGHSEERIKLINPSKVPCDVNITLRPKRNAADIGGSTTPAPEVGGRGKKGTAAVRSKADDDGDQSHLTAFEVDEKHIYIPMYEHRYVTVTFSPTAMQAYSAVFEATVEGATPQSKSRCLNFELRGDGTLPHIVVESPSELGKDGSVIVNFGKLLVGRRTRRRVILKNDGIVPAVIRWDLKKPLPPSVKFTARDRDVLTLDPQQQQAFEVSFEPREVQKLNAEIKYHLSKNPFESVTFSVIGECYQDDVTIEGLIPEGMDVVHSENAIEFDECSIGSRQECTFALKNHCSSLVRFAWPAQAAEQDLVFRPSVGHIAPGASKSVKLVFAPRQSRQHQNHPVNCTMQKIAFKPKDKTDEAIQAAKTLELSSDWDDTKRILRSEAEVVMQQAAGGTRTEEKREKKGGKGKADKSEKNKEIIAEPKIAVGSDGMLEVPLNEPSYDVQKGSDRKLEVRVTAVADWARYECAVKSIKFHDTLMFQTRSYSFTLKNTSQARMEFSFDLFMPDNQTIESPDDENAPFRVSPMEGIIPAGQTQNISVWFEPIEVDTYMRTLVCTIPDLHESQQPFSVPVFGTSSRPLCHFELAESDYLSSGRRNPELRGPHGHLGSLSADTRVLEIQSCGVRIKNIARFFVLNPTSYAYEFQWICEDEVEPGLETHQSFRCTTPKGLIMAGKKFEMIFEFLPENLELKESFWRFAVNDYNVDVPFLLVGTASEPDVALDRTHINFKALLVGKKASQSVSLVNSEVVPFAFNVDKNSFNANELTISPMKGVVPPGGSIALTATLSLKEEHEFNINVGILVKSKPTRLNLNIKAESYLIHCKVLLDGDGTDTAEPLASGPHRVNQVVFRDTQINEQTVRRLRIINSGRLKFDYELQLQSKKSRVVNITPERGEVRVNDRACVDLVYKPFRESLLKNWNVILRIANGPVYSLALSGVGKKPGLEFSFTEHNFGVCFVQREGVQAPSTSLSVKNVESKRSLSFETHFLCPDWLKVGATTTVLAPGEVSHIPISFHPNEEKKFSSVIPLEVNGCYTIPITVNGEGAEPKVEFVESWMEVVAFGALLTGKTVKKSMKVVNRGKLSSRIRLSSPNLHKRGITLSPALGQELSLAPRQVANIDAVFHSDSRIPPFNERVDVELVAAGMRRPFCEISGAVHGYDLKLENDLLAFGSVVVNSQASRRLQLTNSGDIGCKYKWALNKFGPDFSIRPHEGFIHPGTDVTFEITFNPAIVNDDVRYEKLPCRTDAGNLYLTLTGMCVDQPSEADTVVFKCPVRQKETQGVKVKNTSASTLRIRPTFSHPAFTGTQWLEVVSGQTSVYQITYNPIEMTKEGEKHVGTVFFPLADGGGLVYNLSGISQAPLPAGQISLDVPAKSTKLEPLRVDNWLNKPQKFKVSIELEKADPSTSLTGLPSIDLPPHAARDFELVFRAEKECTAKGKVTFTNTMNGEYVYYDFAAKVTAPGIIDTIKLETPVRQPLKHQLFIPNPLPSTVQAACQCSHPDIEIPNQLTLGASCETPLVFRYLPLLAKGQHEAKLLVQSQELGTSTYLLKLKSTAAAHEKNIVFNVSLGSSMTQAFRFIHYARQKTEYTCKVDGDFDAEKSVTVGPASSGGTEVSVDVSFEPTQLGDHKSTLVVKSSVGGEYVCPLFGHCVSPKPQGPLVMKAGNSVAVPFKNVFGSNTEFTYTVDNPCFILSKHTETVQAKKTSRIEVTFKPSKAGDREKDSSRRPRDSIASTSVHDRASVAAAAAAAAERPQSAVRDELGAIPCKLTVTCSGISPWIYYLKGI